MNIPTSDIQITNPSAEISFFILDLNTIGTSAVYYFCPSGQNQQGGSIVWQGVTYQPWPVQADGFEITNQGVMPRPKIQISNLDGSIGSLVRQHGDLVGAKLTRKRTLAKYLDAVNFPGGNVNADPLKGFADDVYEINQKTTEDSQAGFMEFELRAAMDLDGFRIPRRIMQAQLCGWRSTDTAICPFAATCAKKLSDCRTNYPTGKLPFGGFPGLALTGLS